LGCIIIIIIIVLFFAVSCHRTSLPSTSPLKTNSYPHCSCFKFQSATHSILCVMLQAQLSIVLNLLNVFLYRTYILFVFALPLIGIKTVVLASKLTSVELKLN